MNDSIHDVIIIGGGPAGCAAAIELLRRSRARGRGHDVVVIERDTYPRFHIGESMLPGTWDLIEQLGLADAISQIPHVPKFGGEFGMGDGSESTRFMFGNGLREYFAETLNIERSIFDQIFIDEARKQGADVRQGVSVKQIDNLADGDVRVTTTDGPLRGRYIIDASGQNSVIGRHLGTRRAIDDPRFKKVAYYEHFENVRRLDGKEEGHPAIAMCEEGWFWLIPINERITSVGLVLDADIARSIDVPANRMLAWGIARCPGKKPCGS
jgi:flavin-dependent dehydrogenase